MGASRQRRSVPSRTSVQVVVGSTWSRATRRLPTVTTSAAARAKEPAMTRKSETMPALLEQLGFPRLEWARFKNTLDTGMIEGAIQQVAPEYRDLVRRYFLLLAREEELK